MGPFVIFIHWGKDPSIKICIRPFVKLTKYSYSFYKGFLLRAYWRITTNNSGSFLNTHTMHDDAFKKVFSYMRWYFLKKNNFKIAEEYFKKDSRNEKTLIIQDVLLQGNSYQDKYMQLISHSCMNVCLTLNMKGKWLNGVVRTRKCIFALYFAYLQCCRHCWQSKKLTPYSQALILIHIKNYVDIIWWNGFNFQTQAMN